MEGFIWGLQIEMNELNIFFYVFEYFFLRKFKCGHNLLAFKLTEFDAFVHIYNIFTLYERLFWIYILETWCTNVRTIFL